jgi:hypothetical protein
MVILPHYVIAQIGQLRSEPISSEQDIRSSCKLDGNIIQLFSPDQFSNGSITEDFENIDLMGNEVPLQDQILGVKFHGPLLQRGALIENPLGFELVPTTKDIQLKSAYSTGPTMIEFGNNITELGTYISPSSIAFNNSSIPIHRSLLLQAFDSEDRPIGTIRCPMLVSTNNNTEIQNYRPTFLGVKSETPISKIILVQAGKNPFFFDDLKYYMSMSALIPYRITTNIPIEEENLVKLTINNRTIDGTTLPIVLYKEIDKNEEANISSFQDEEIGIWYDFKR